LKSFIQLNFQYYWKINKSIECRLFIRTLPPLGLAFFNFINKFLTILYIVSFSTSFYILFFSYILYDFKWSKIFQVCSQLSLRNESKDTPLFRTFFPYKCDLVKCSCLDFHKAIEWIFVNSNANILQST